MAIIFKTWKISVGEDVVSWEPLGAAGGKVKWCTHVESSVSAPHTPTVELTVSAILLLGVYAAGLAAGAPTDACTLVVCLGC